MAYSTLADIQGHVPVSDLIQLTDDDGVAVDQSVVDEAISFADELINGYLRGRYDASTLPLNPAPALIKKISMDIATHRLYSRRLNMMADVIEKQHQNALKLLGQLQQGVISLGIESGTQGAGFYKTNKQPSDRVFSRDTMDTF